MILAWDAHYHRRQRRIMFKIWTIACKLFQKHVLRTSMFRAATNETCLLVLWFRCFGLLVSAVACFAVPHRKLYQRHVQYMDLICLARLWAHLLVLIVHHCGMIFYTCGTIACENKLCYAILNFGQRNVV